MILGSAGTGYSGTEHSRQGRAGLIPCDPMQPLQPHPSFSEALRFWLKLGFISFGGPTGQIAIMHGELVERKRWVSEARFLHALNYCMLLPGPEAQQLAIYIGWLLHGTLGGLVAGILFVLPSAIILWGLSYVYVTWGTLPAIAAVFYGLKPAVVAIVAHAVLRIGKRTLKNEIMWALAASAFVAIYFLQAPFPAIIAGAALVGLVGARFAPSHFDVIKGHSSAGDGEAVQLAPSAAPSWGRVVRVILLSGALWWTPIACAGAMLGAGHPLTQLGLFFSKAAMVTFGGAYAVLPYVAQQAVERYAWLAPGQMLDGLGLAETTPGPLIMVVQFVGFLGGWNHPDPWTPLVSATLAAAMTTWVTFVPCFLWIFLGAPYVEGLRRSRVIGAALSCITAAVVGVVLNLAVWFALGVVLPAGMGFDYFAGAIVVASIGLLAANRVGVIGVVALGTFAGVFRFAVGL